MSEHMTELDWRKRYAPLGYRYAKTRISFETLERARNPAGVLSVEIDRLRDKLEREVEGRFNASVFTRLTVFPKDIGETLNHLDPLRPRFGIEIEMRQAVASIVLQLESEKR
jgi:hypothetical protein